jgi:hypothetical protein
LKKEYEYIFSQGYVLPLEVLYALYERSERPACGP